MSLHFWSPQQDIYKQYMASPEGREKVLISAYNPVMNLLQAWTYGISVPPDRFERRREIRRFERILEEIPLLERGDAWQKLQEAVDMLLKV